MQTFRFRNQNYSGFSKNGKELCDGVGGVGVFVAITLFYPLNEITSIAVEIAKQIFLKKEHPSKVMIIYQAKLYFPRV